MLEHLRSLPASLNSRSSGDSASFAAPHEEHVLWMQKMDITPFDFSYLGSLLQQAYSDWKSQVHSGLTRTSTFYSVWNTEGDCLGYDSDREADPGVDTRMLVLECINKRQALSLRGTSERGEYLLITHPLFSRANKDMFAVFTAVIYESDQYETSKAVIQSEALHYRTCFYRRFEYIVMTDLLHAHEHTAREEHRRSILFQIVQRMHDKMDVDAILDEVFDSMDYLYPATYIKLYMSQDQSNFNPRIKPLLVHERGEDICVRSFMEGKLIVARLDDGESRIVEVGLPLKGKQGIYGVFHIEMNEELMEESDLQLITMMVDTAGTAFENAKLHEQSNMLIQELRLINDLTQRLNKSLQLMEIYQSSEQELKGIFQADCCILQLNDSTNQFEVMSTNVKDIYHRSFPADYGIAGLLYRTEEPLIVSNYAQYDKVSSVFMQLTGSMSLIASPLRVNGEVKGAILLGHAKEQYFSYDNYRLLQMLSIHIGLALSNATLHAEVRRLANLDMLTGLYVRHYLDSVIHERQAQDYCGSLIVVDIDQFKQVNDTFGHQTGDQVLKQVSEIVTSSVRSEDICARWGGEELAIYMPQVGIRQALAYAEIIRTRVEEETRPPVTVSSGIAEWNWMDEKVSVESLFYRADMALYSAKHGGRNRIVVEEQEVTR